jgi:chromatin remodeling complex protein RSC6
MVRASSKSATAPVPAPAVVVTPGVVVEKAKKAPRAKKAVEEVAAPVVAAPTPVAAPAPVVEESAAVEETAVDKSTPAGALLAEIAEFNKNFQAWSNFGNALKANIKNITKISSKVSKNADKSTKRKKNAKSKPSGFEKPTPISDELAVFFGRELGTLMARTEVSKQIHDYVMQQKLQNAANRRIIHPDAKLKQLLNVNNDELTYFNLQKYLKFHFKKETVTPLVAKA